MFLISSIVSQVFATVNPSKYPVSVHKSRHPFTDILLVVWPFENPMSVHVVWVELAFVPSAIGPDVSTESLLLAIYEIACVFVTDAPSLHAFAVRLSVTKVSKVFVTVLVLEVTNPVEKSSSPLALVVIARGHNKPPSTVRQIIAPTTFKNTTVAKTKYTLTVPYLSNPLSRILSCIT
jgi:hypothetical protein